MLHFFFSECHVSRGGVGGGPLGYLFLFVQLPYI